MAEDVHPAPGSFPFTRLPPDIQYSICQSLCAHCGNEDPMSILYHKPEEQTQTLLSLCATSRSMHSLAQSILYHFPRVYSYTDFFRTLRSRPKLADCVKVQRWIYENDTRPGKEPREDIWYLRDLAVGLGLDDTEMTEFSHMYRDYPYGDEQDVTGSGRYEFGIAFDNFITALTLALCPRLEFLSINLDDGRYEMRDCYPKPAKYRYLSGLIKPDGFPFLHTLVLKNTLHHDPNTLGLDRVSFIWSLFPSVTRLIFFRGTSEDHIYTDILVPEDAPRPEYSWSALPHLKELRFVRFSRYQRELPLPTIRRLVARCNGLEKFVFSPIGLEGTVFAPARLLQTISSTSSTLRHLAINCAIPEEACVDADQLLGSELKQFTRLESLILDQAVFCHHHHDLTSTRGPKCLTDMVPESVRQLTINMHATFAPIADVVALGKAVASQTQHTSLAHLRVQMTFEDEYWLEVDPPTTPPADGHRQYRRAPYRQRPPEVNRPLLEPRRRLQKEILVAFQDTSVRVGIDFYRRRPFRRPNDWQLLEPSPPSWSDAKLIDVEINE